MGKGFGGESAAESICSNPNAWNGVKERYGTRLQCEIGTQESDQCTYTLQK